MPGPNEKEQEESTGHDFEKLIDKMYGREEEEEEEDEDKDKKQDDE